MNQAQSLLIDGLTKTKHVANAAIIKISDGSVWTSTPGFTLQTQVPLFLHAFSRNLLRIRKEGMYFKDRYYTCVRADDYSIYLKGKDYGLVAVRTKAFILIGTYSQGMYPSVCVEAVERLADYIREKGN
ncbi:hypothetical protein lerEdw1_004797 [Lerista edwardsae]|nr:hypothetical protein lerEdw1_004797 [Lerista edwardsae]